jgi:hypothetical protein
MESDMAASLRAGVIGCTIARAANAARETRVRDNVAGVPSGVSHFTQKHQ